MSTLSIKDKPAPREPCGEDPDKWFRVMPPGFSSKKTMQKVACDVQEAIETCNSCPVQKECLELGMLPENEAHGVWGGLMAAERMLLNGRDEEDFPHGTAMFYELKLFKYVKSYVHDYYENIERYHANIYL